jgi:hypothetical protein
MKIGSTTNNSVIMALWAMATSSCQATTSTGTTRIAGYQTKSKVTGVSSTVVDKQGVNSFFSENVTTHTFILYNIVEQNRFGSGRTGTAVGLGQF